MIWSARVILVGTNGESGTIDLSATNLCGAKDIELFLGKAVRMASTLQQAHMEELEPASARQPFKVVG
jgi:hypothetical protein